MMISGAILAGKQSGRGPLLEFAGVKHKAFIEIDGRTMIQHVIDAMNESRYIHNIYIIAPEFFDKIDFESRKPLKIVPCGNTVVENELIAFERSENAESVLIATCDIPLFRGFMLDEFIRRCQKGEAAVFYSIVEEGVIRKKFPRAKRTYVRFREGGFNAADVIFLDKKSFSTDPEQLDRMGEKVYQYRKTPWKYYVDVLGLGFFLKFVFRRLTLEELEASASKVIGSKFKLISMPYPECALDVDKVSDLAFVRELVRESGWPREGK